MTCGDISGLKPGQARLTVLSNEEGKALDDTIVTNMGDYMYVGLTYTGFFLTTAFFLYIYYRHGISVFMCIRSL